MVDHLVEVYWGFPKICYLAAYFCSHLRETGLHFAPSSKCIIHSHENRMERRSGMMFSGRVFPWKSHQIWLASLAFHGSWAMNFDETWPGKHRLYGLFGFWTCQFVIPAPWAARGCQGAASWMCLFWESLSGNRKSWCCWSSPNLLGWHSRCASGDSWTITLLTLLNW